MNDNSEKARKNPEILRQYKIEQIGSAVLLAAKLHDALAFLEADTAQAAFAHLQDIWDFHGGLQGQDALIDFIDDQVDWDATDFTSLLEEVVLEFLLSNLVELELSDRQDIFSERNVPIFEGDALLGRAEVPLELPTAVVIDTPEPDGTELIWVYQVEGFGQVYLRLAATRKKYLNMSVLLQFSQVGEQQFNLPADPTTATDPASMFVEVGVPILKKLPRVQREALEAALGQWESDVAIANPTKQVILKSDGLVTYLT